MAGSRELENVIAGLCLQIEPVTVEQGRMALMAFWRYGRGCFGGLIAGKALIMG